MRLSRQTHAWIYIAYDIKKFVQLKNRTTPNTINNNTIYIILTKSPVIGYNNTT